MYTRIIELFCWTAETGRHYRSTVLPGTSMIVQLRTNFQCRRRVQSLVGQLSPHLNYWACVLQLERSPHHNGGLGVTRPDSQQTNEYCSKNQIRCQWRRFKDWIFTLNLDIKWSQKKPRLYYPQEGELYPNLWWYVDVWISLWAWHSQMSVLLRGGPGLGFWPQETWASESAAALEPSCPGYVYYLFQPLDILSLSLSLSAAAATA